MIHVDAPAGSPAALAYAAAAPEERFTFAPAVPADAEILVAGRAVDDLLAAAPRLRWVAFWNAGIDASLTPALLERAAAGLLVTNASGVHGAQMAEHAFALILAHTRGIARAVRAQSTHTWSRAPYEGDGIEELAGQSLGIVGMGHIGEALAARARAFEMTVRGVRRTHSRAELDEVLGCDHVVVLVPLTEATRGMIGDAELARMKPTARLYNLARGGVVDETALVAALRRGAIAGAGLDVFAREPLPADSPLWDLPNVVLTPHVGGVTPRYYERTAALFAANLARFRRGAPLAEQHDLARGY